MSNSQPDDSQDRLWAEFNDQIRNLLNKHRPDRTSASDKDWLEPVYGWARNHLPDERHAIRNLAKAKVDGLEGAATKRGNDYVRQWAKGQRPLFWADLGPLPISVGNGERVRFDAATPDDVEDAALDLHAKGKATYDEVVLLTETMHDLARKARRAGLSIVALIGDQPPRDGDNTGDDDEDEDF